jgi:hypothetical protein
MLGPILPAPGGGGARRPLALASRRHRTGDSFHEATDPQSHSERLAGNQQQRIVGTTMSAKLLRSVAEQIFATNHEAIGGVVLRVPKPITRWPGVFAVKRKDAGHMASMEWKRARLPCRREDWWL